MIELIDLQPEPDFSNYFTLYNPVTSTKIIIPKHKLNQDTSENFPTFAPIYNFNQEYPIFNQPETVVEEPVQEQKKQPEPELKTQASVPEQPQLRSFQSNSEIVNKAITAGRSQLGKRYHTGTHGPNSYDCSGFIYYMYRTAGLKVPLSIFELAKYGTPVSSIKDARIGDVIVTPGSGQSGLHVKMISEIKENGDIYVIEAAGKKTGVIERKLTNTSNIKSIRRYV